MAEYVAVSTAVTDDIWLANGIHIGEKLGGAGIYAYCGMKLWCDDVVLVSGIGKDFLPAYQNWFMRNGCSMAGLTICDEHTPHTNVQYLDSGERTEKALYGRAHYHKMEAAAADVIPYLREAKGVYIFRDLIPEYWNQIFRAKKIYGFAVEWELNSRVASIACQSEVRRIAEQCDVLSLNITEARALLGEQSVEMVLDRLRTWKMPMIYLRLGSNGGAIIRKGRITKTPTVNGVKVMDPTGAGNSSSAAVLYAYCEGFDDVECGLIGSISAAKCIEQYGPPELSSINRDKLYEKLYEMKQQLLI